MTASDDPQETTTDTAWHFEGFVEPVDHYTKMPHTFIDVLPRIETKAELAVVVYIMRHTWGFGEFDQPKKITLDEFVHGRRRRDRSRMDGGVGMSKNAVMDGLNLAIEHGFIEVERDEHDAARIRKFYRLTMMERVEGRGAACCAPTTLTNEDARQEFRNCSADVQKLNPRGSETPDRTEKETLEKEETGRDAPSGASLDLPELLLLHDGRRVTMAQFLEERRKGLL